MNKVRDLAISFPVTYSMSEENFTNSSPKILLLHGFLQNADVFLKQVKSAFIDPAEVVSLQAPFPVFRQRLNQYEVGYSWFFYDAKSKTYLVKRDFALNYCHQAMEQLQWGTNIETIIGYSQGGYMAPFVAEKLPNVKQVIGVHSRFRHEDLNRRLSFRLDQIHGADDQVVDPGNSEGSHKQMMTFGNKGSFQLLMGVGHEINSLVLDSLKKAIL